MNFDLRSLLASLIGKKEEDDDEVFPPTGDSQPLSLQQIMQQKHPRLMEQYKVQDHFQRGGPNPHMSPAEIQWRINPPKPGRYRGLT